MRNAQRHHMERLSRGLATAGGRAALVVGDVAPAVLAPTPLFVPLLAPNSSASGPNLKGSE